ncbi:hypothetical protein VHEMI08506 [[Torrubiella] hemipterigena]|uniref:Extracellular membrane protein CFEM domain-containing protein n=1 Tax=[Torrubiella] hemipterigena TaxID=1531966 RepID=A0A0A1TNL0_9HYPO|nr:hypothetical protein VHEMI08506 [[Torrubiella] hemipterigena]
MHAATAFLALSAALPAVLAYDPEFLTWCHESELNVNGVRCLGWQMPNKCVDCLMPIEHQCPGDWDSDEFLDCFCPIPTGQWPKIQSCFNNAANECQGSPSEVFNAYSTMCFKWRERQAEYVCEPKNQEGNLAVSKLTRFVCPDPDAPKPPKPTTSSTPKSTSSVSGLPSSSAAVPKPTTCSTASTSKPSPTGTGNNGTVPCGGPGCGTPPVVAGAGAAQLSAAAVLAAAAAAFL